MLWFKNFNQNLTQAQSIIYHISQAKQELMLFLVCRFIYTGIFLCIRKFMSLVHTIRKDKQIIYPVNWKNTSKSCMTVVKTIFHAGLLDPITLGYEWLQTRFCSWSISTAINFDSIAQLRKLCQSSKKPGYSFYGPAPIFLNCIKLACNFIKWAVSVISSYKHPAAFQILKNSGLLPLHQNVNILDVFILFQ